MKNKYFIITIIVLIIYIIFSFMQTNKEYQGNYFKYFFGEEKNISVCYDTDNPEKPECKDIKVKSDPLYDYYRMIGDDVFNYILFFAPLFIMIPLSIIINKKMKKGYMKNTLTRISYKDYIKKIYKENIKFLFILPCFVIFLFILCSILDGHFSNYGELSYLDSVPFNNKNAIIFMVQYILNLFLFSFTYMNIVFICSSKNSNMFVTMIYSYLCYFIIDIIGEIFIGGLLFGRILKIYSVANYLNLFNSWQYFDCTSILYLNLYPLFLVIITSFIVYLLYKNKEKVIIENEK